VPEAIPQAALNQHIAILGKTGSGKTYAAKGIVEHLLRQERQVCILDPTGAWYGLRLAANGKGRGFDVVLLGGQQADIPLAERSGPAVARLVTQQGASVVIDTSGFTVGEYTRWFIDFAGTLYTTIVNPLHLVIDEAHYFMPQGKSPDVDAGRMLHAGNRLMSGGRSKGIRGMLITQRPAKLHKDSLTCADTLIAMRVIAPQDRGAIKDWIDGAGDAAQGKAVLDSLAGLKRGEGWVWYPEGGHLERVKFPTIKTYDSSATPAHGAKAGPKVTEIKLDEVKQALAEAVKEAEANDPKLLRQRIAELERQAKATPKPAAATDQAALDRAKAAGAAERDRELRPLITERDRIIKDLSGRMGKAASLLHVNGEAMATEAPPAVARTARGDSPQVVVAQGSSPRGAKEPVKYDRNYARIDTGDLPKGDLPKGETAILSALIQFPDGLRREQLTVLTGYKRSTRDAYIQRLREKGFVDDAGGIVQATDAGISALPNAEPLPTGPELQAYWLARLPQGERALLEQLITAYPAAVDREDLTTATGYQRSTRDAYLQRMRAKQLIEEPGRGMVRASGNLF